MTAAVSTTESVRTVLLKDSADLDISFLGLQNCALMCWGVLTNMHTRVGFSASDHFCHLAHCVLLQTDMTESLEVGFVFTRMSQEELWGMRKEAKSPKTSVLLKLICQALTLR